MALIFLMYGAPDVALTQLMVETLTVIIVAVVLLRLPDLHDRACDDRPLRVADALLSYMLALPGMVELLLTATEPALPPREPW